MICTNCKRRTVALYPGQVCKDCRDAAIPAKKTKVKPVETRRLVKQVGFVLENDGLYKQQKWSREKWGPMSTAKRYKSALFAAKAGELCGSGTVREIEKKGSPDA